jgi:hypothetical protein
LTATNYDGRWEEIGIKRVGYLSDGHCAEDVEEDEGALGEVIPREVPMGEPLDPRDWNKRQPRNDSTVKS